MPRRLIIGILVVLILGIVGGTSALLLRRIRQTTPEAADPVDPATLELARQGGQQLTNPGSDDDGDGLNNGDERVWGTDPSNRDTDGDGFIDGAEVLANHNPTIAGPNDTLPAGFRPGQELQPLTEAPRAPVAVDQFFADNLDLSGGTTNFTERYQQQFPETERTPDTLMQFVRGQEIVTQLPEPLARTLVTQATDTPLVFSEYMEVAGNLGVFSNRVAVAEALNDLLTSQDPAGVRGLAVVVRLHQETLLTQRVPPSAANLHKLLLGYTELLAATYDLLTRYVEDPVKGTLAIRQLQEIDEKYYPVIEQEVDRLNAVVATLTEEADHTH